jgi:hypothetical protein
LIDSAEANSVTVQSLMVRSDAGLFGEPDLETRSVCLVR